jgi:homoserine O-acetyltransferase
VLCPDFLIETYLDHQGESFCLKYDANSLIYISKAMDLFDMSIDSLQEIEAGRRLRAQNGSSGANTQSAILCELPGAAEHRSSKADKAAPRHISSLPSSLAAHFNSLTEGLKNLSRTPTLIIGVQSDALFPFVQQRELAEALRENGNKEVVYYELDSPMGHDSFLLDVANVTAALRGFL